MAPRVWQIHRLFPRHGAKTWPDWRRTLCGRSGAAAMGTDREFETDVGTRFEAVETNDEVTCQRCRATIRNVETDRRLVSTGPVTPQSLPFIGWRALDGKSLRCDGSAAAGFWQSSRWRLCA